MGSFNTSCFVSQQTIAPGDEAVILPIQKQTTYNPVELSYIENGERKETSMYGFAHSSCYPTAFWGFAGPIIKGTYDDYGCFNLEETESNILNLNSFFNSLDNKLCDVKQGENKYHEHSLVVKELYDSSQTYNFTQLHDIWNTLWNLAQENRLFVKGFYGVVPLSFAVMHKESANYMIEQLSNSENYDGKSLEQRSYFEDFINSVITRGLDIFKEKNAQDLAFFFISRIADLEGIRIGEQEGAYISGYYDFFDSVNEKLKVYFETNPDTKSIDKSTVDELFEIVKDQLDHRYILSGLTGLNVKLSPMVYASQDYCNDIGNSYLKMVKEVNNRVNKGLKERNGDDWDEEEDEVATEVNQKKASPNKKM